MMLSSRLTVTLLCGAVLLSITSCSDPASVGMGVGPDSLSGGDPQVKQFVPSSLESASVPSATGYAPASSLTDDQTRPWRFLTGTVVDPLAGTIETEGYVDFHGTADRPSSFSEAVADSLNAELRLQRSYLHGNSTATLEIQLFDLSDEADMGRAPADTTFAADPLPIRSETYSVSATDTLVSLPLPTSWIEEHQSAIQNSDTFDGSSFHGFKLTTKNEGAVVGYAHDSATLRVTTSSDTVDFQPEQTFTQIERTAEPTTPVPNDRILVQDGVGEGLRMSWGENSPIDSLANTNVLLNRAEITVPVDTVYTQPDPGSNFVRPLPSGYRVLATPVSGELACSQLGLYSLTEAGETCVFPSIQGWVPGAARIPTSTAFTVFNRWFADGAPLTSFRVGIANRPDQNLSERQTAQRGIPSTVPVVIRTSPSYPKSELPRATLTVTPL